MATPVNTADLILENANRSRFIRPAKNFVNTTTAPWSNLSLASTNTASAVQINVTTSGTVYNPFGTPAQLWSPTTVTGSHLSATSLLTGALVSGDVYQTTLYVKDDGVSHYRPVLVLQAQNAAATVNNYITAVFDPVTGTVSGQSLNAGWSNQFVTVTAVGTGWWKVVMGGTFTPTASEIKIFTQFQIRDATSTISFAGTGTTGVYLYGAQAYVAQQPDEVIGDSYTDASGTQWKWNGYAWYIAAAAAKTISLTNSTQTFTYDGTGALSPAGQYVRFDVQKQNTTNAVTWTTSPVINLYDAATAGAITTSANPAYMRAADFAANSAVSITATVTDGSALVDSTTIVRLQNGSTSIIGMLTNEAANVSAASDGTGYSVGTSGGTFKIYSGTTDVTTSSLFGIGTTGTVSATQNGLTLSINTATGLYSLAGASWTTDFEVFNIVGAYGGNTLTKVYKITKSKAGTAGVAGTNAVTAILGNDSTNIVCNAAGTPTSYTGSGTDIYVYEGNTFYTYVASVTANNQFSIATAVSGIAVGSITASGSGTNRAQVAVASTMTTNPATITYTITARSSTGQTITLTKIQTFTKSITGAAGSTGTRGTITTSININPASAWVDASATTAITNAGGISPIQGDIVTQYNSAANFSQTMVRTSGATWSVLTAFYGGDVIVDGTIKGAKIKAGEITASKIAVTDNTNLIGNPSGIQNGVSSSDGWSGMNAGVANGILGGGSLEPYLHNTTRDNYYGVFFAVTPGDQFYCEFVSVPEGGATGDYNTSLGLNLYVSNPTDDTSQQWLGGATRTAAQYGVLTTSGTVIIPAGYNYARVWLQIATASTSAGYYYKNMKVVRKHGASLVVDGSISAQQISATAGITANQIDTRSLTIKDASGNVIFGAGSQIGNDAATSLGFNPTFSAWSGTYPDGWVAWAQNGTLTKVQSGSAVTPYFTFWQCTGSDLGMMQTFSYPNSAPLPAGSYLKGSCSMYMGTFNGGGPPGYLIRCYTTAAHDNNYVDNYITIPNKTVGGWQRFSFTASANGQAIYAVQIYQMPSWGGFGNMAAGSSVYFGPFSFDIHTAIISTNASTYIANAAIDSLQINNLRTSNYAEDGSANPTAGAKLASTGTALKVANNSLQIGTAIFTDYWARLVQGIDGTASSAIIWRGNNDATTLGGAPNINCLIMTAMHDQTINNNFQQTYFNYTLQPTSYTSYTDNLDAMQQIHIQFFSASTSNAPFTETYQVCPSRVYNGSSGAVGASLHWGWRYSGTGATSAGGPLETNNAYNAYIRVRIGNSYGFSATKDFYGGGASASVGRQFTSTTITGQTGSGGGGGGGSGGSCPAPWVKVRLQSGIDVPASDLYNGCKVAAVNDGTLEPVIGGGTISNLQTIWSTRYRIKLTDGTAPEFSKGHRLAIVDRGWVPIEDIRPGDHIMGLTEAIVESNIAVGEGQVISYQVNGAGTYFAGGLLCHNTKMIP